MLPLPPVYHGANLRWRANHYELCLTLDTGEPLPPARTGGAVAGVDLGEVHITSMTTTRRHALLISGRQLRAWRNKVHRLLQENLDHCQPTSRRAKRLRHGKAQVSAKLYRQQRDVLHQAAKTLVDFARAEGVSQIVVGDGRAMQTGVNVGKKTNQKISPWPHGQFART